MEIGFCGQDFGRNTKKNLRKAEKSPISVENSVEYVEKCVRVGVWKTFLETHWKVFTGAESVRQNDQNYQKKEEKRRLIRGERMWKIWNTKTI